MSGFDKQVEPNKRHRFDKATCALYSNELLHLMSGLTSKQSLVESHETCSHTHTLLLPSSFAVSVTREKARVIWCQLLSFALLKDMFKVVTTCSAQLKFRRSFVVASISLALFSFYDTFQAAFVAHLLLSGFIVKIPPGLHMYSQRNYSISSHVFLSASCVLSQRPPPMKIMFLTLLSCPCGIILYYNTHYGGDNQSTSWLRIPEFILQSSIDRLPKMNCGNLEEILMTCRCGV